MTGRPAAEELPELLDVAQVAEYLGLHRGTVVAFARRGKLPAFKVGREWRFRADDIRGWVESRSHGDDFGARFDRLWEALRKQAEASGYTAEEVPRLIEEVRQARARSGASRG